MVCYDYLDPRICPDWQIIRYCQAGGRLLLDYTGLPTRFQCRIQTTPSLHAGDEIAELTGSVCKIRPVLCSGI